MALTIIETPGAADANSLSSLAEFLAYLTTHPDGAAALALDAEAQKRALITATNQFEALIEWAGYRVTSTQRLSHPRYGLDLEGYAVSHTVVHDRVKLAHQELARHILQDGMPSTPSATAGFRKMKVDVVEIEYEPGGSAVDPIPDDVWYLLPTRWGRVRNRHGVQMVPLRRV